MKKPVLFGLLFGSLMGLHSSQAWAQVALGSSPYTENFDNIGTGLPTGFSVYTGATATGLGTAATLTTAATAWNNSTGAFKNFASATGLTAASDAAAQAAATNRALGVRQTGTFGDPGAAFVFQGSNLAGKTDFELSFKLQSLDNTSPRTVSWTVDYAIGANPTSFTPLTSGTGTTGNSTFSNNTITASFGNALDNATGPVTIRVVTLAASTGTGARPSTAIDDFSLSWQTASPTAPALTLSAQTLTFPGQNVNTSSTAQTYTLTGANLTADVTVTATGPFTVSKDNTTFGSSVTLTPAELSATRTMSVRFTPTATGPATGSITHTSAGATTRTLTLNGTGTSPNQTVYSFQSCAAAGPISDGWTQFSVSGAQTWACTTFGRDANDPTGQASAASGVQMNGFAAGASVPNEDWLISPALNLTSTTFPLFSFWSRGAFVGPTLRLLVSTNYSGTGSPAAAGVTWTDLNATFPATGANVWTLTNNVDLSAYKQAGVYLAFVYTSTSDEAARWTLDDIALTNSATAPPPAIRASTAGLTFGYRAVNTSATQTLNATFTNLTGDVTVSSSDPAFQVSPNGTTFSSSVTLTQAAANGNTLPLTVRFNPTQATRNYNGNLTLTSAGAPTVTIPLSGNTYDVANTLEVVNWNIEWFGSAVNGPSDKTLQFNNVRTVLQTLDADVFALSEIVDTVRLRTLVSQMPGYAYKIAEFGSYADNRQDPDYATAQKLAFVYRTSVVSNPSFTSFFRCTEAQACAAHNHWSSGRFPYVMTANVRLGNVTQQVTFVLIHAKANTNPIQTSYDRRKAGADALKAELDARYATANVVVLGDFNDDLDQTISTGLTPPTTTTSYVAFTSDATNYPALTLPLSLAGKKSTVSFNDVIDHVIVSNEMNAFYIPGTAEIQTGVAGQIANYGNTTSDHFPVMTRFSFNNVTSTASVRRSKLGLYPNPASKSVRIELPEQSNALKLQVHTTDGRLVLNATGSVEQLNQQLNQKLGGLNAGMYVVRVVGAQQTYVERFVKQ